MPTDKISCSKVFAMYDKNNDGIISSEEIKRAKVTDASVKIVIDAFNEQAKGTPPFDDKSDAMTFWEYMEAVNQFNPDKPIYSKEELSKEKEGNDATEPRKLLKYFYWEKETHIKNGKASLTELINLAKDDYYALNELAEIADSYYPEIYEGYNPTTKSNDTLKYFFKSIKLDSFRNEMTEDIELNNYTKIGLLAKHGNNYASRIFNDYILSVFNKAFELNEENKQWQIIDIVNLWGKRGNIFADIINKENGSDVVFENLTKLLNIKKASNEFYYTVADTILKIILDSNYPRELKEKELLEFRQNYRGALSRMSYDKGENSDEVMDIVNKAIDIIGTDKATKCSNEAESRFKRAPQMILFYLIIPKVVYPFIEAHKRMKDNGIKIDLSYLIAVSFAEGYIESARSVIETNNVNNANYSEGFNTRGPIGLDAFVNCKKELIKANYLRRNFDSFISIDESQYKNEARDSFSEASFKDAAAAIEACGALMLNSRERYLKAVSSFRKPTNEDEIRVGTYLFYCSATPYQYLKENMNKYGTLIGKYNVAKHGHSPYNAQWPAATAKFLDMVFGKE